MAVLFATDFSDRSISALREAARQAQARDAELTLVNTLEELRTQSVWTSLFEDLEELREHMLNERLEHLQSFYDEHVDAETRGALSTTFRVMSGRASDNILKLAEELDAQLIVVGSSGKGQAMATLLGSVSNDLVRQSHRPVMVVPDHEGDAQAPNGPILVPVDFSPVGIALLEHARTLAERDGTKLLVVHSIGSAPARMDRAFSVDPGAIDRAVALQRQGLEQIISALGLSDAVSVLQVEIGDAHSVIRDAAKKHSARLIVIGSHGHRGLQRWMLGNTAERVLREVLCPVLVLRETLEEDSPHHDLLNESSSPRSERVNEKN